MSAEQAVRLASKFYDSRDLLRRLHGETYSVECKPYRAVICAIMKRENLNEILAVKWLLEKAERDNVPPSTKGILAMWLLAAAVDLTEDIGKTHEIH